MESPKIESDPRKVTPGRIFLYALLGFGPIWLGWFGLGWGTLLSLFLIPLFDSQYGSADVLTPFLVIVGPPLLVVGSYFLFRSRQSWVIRGSVVYSTWLILAFAFCGTILTSVGGASMASVDGGASAREAVLTTRVTFEWVLYSHIVILPWVLFSTILMKKKPHWVLPTS